MIGRLPALDLITVCVHGADQKKSGRCGRDWSISILFIYVKVLSSNFFKGPKSNAMVLVCCETILCNKSSVFEKYP